MYFTSIKILKNFFLSIFNINIINSISSTITILSIVVSTIFIIVSNRILLNNFLL